MSLRPLSHVRESASETASQETEVEEYSRHDGSSENLSSNTTTIIEDAQKSSALEKGVRDQLNKDQDNGTGVKLDPINEPDGERTERDKILSSLKSSVDYCEVCRNYVFRDYEENSHDSKRGLKTHHSMCFPYEDDYGDLLERPSPTGKLPAQTEVKLTRIANGQYRKIKTWGKGTFGDASMLLMTSDGGEFGYSGGSENDESDEQKGSLEGRRPTNNVPFRLIFNSYEIIDVLCNITNSDYLNQTHHVILRPFKFLIHHETDIRNAHAQFEAAYEAGDEIDNRNSDKSRVSKKFTTKESDITDNTIDKDAKSQASHHDTEATRITTEEVNPKVDEPSQRIYGVEVSRRNRDIIRLVVDFMNNDMNDIFTLRKRIADKALEEISFEYLSHLFKPGDLVIGDAGAELTQRHAYRVLHVTGGRPHIDKPPDHTFDNPGDPLARERFVKRAVDALQPSNRFTPVVLDCFYVDFDGRRLGPRPKQFVLHEYKGLRKIASLEVVPADFVTDNTTDVLLKRGKLLVEIAHSSHMYHKGDAYREGPSMYVGARVERIYGQCIVDQQTAVYRQRPRNYRHDYSLRLEDDLESRNDHLLNNPLGFGKGVIEFPTGYNKNETYEKSSKGRTGFRIREFDETDVNTDFNFDLDQREDYVKQNSLLEPTKDATEGHYILLPDRVWGYVLSHRDFYQLRVSNLSPIQWNTRGSVFKDLVLPSVHKNTIEALVRYQTREVRHKTHSGQNIPQGSSSLDLIDGKGQGLTILLHGMPGTGKTSTAECVAEQLRRPLFTITCGDLGTRAETVEARLNEYFELAAKWSCVMLLDEADVFLTHRTTGDYERNSIVSVFLRQLDYHSGVLILTTNRVGEFDEAIASRIHIKLHYPRLDHSSAIDIWKLNIRRITQNPAFEIKLNDTDVLRFAEKHWRSHEDRPGRQWNGRQIKNAFQTAIALAHFEWESAPPGERGKRPILRRKHFKQVAETSVHFDRHMDKIHGARSQGAYSETAHRHGYRYDEPDYDMMPTPPSISSRLDRPRSSKQHETSHRLSPLGHQYRGQVDRSAMDTGSSEDESETDINEED